MTEKNLSFFAGLEDNFTPEPAPTEDTNTKEPVNLDKETENTDDTKDVEVDEKNPFAELETDNNSEDTDKDNEGAEEDNDIFKVYFEDLKEKNFLDLPEDFEFTGTEESLQEALELTKTKLAEKTRQEIEAGFQEFVFNNLEQIQNTYNTVDFEQVDLSSEDTQKEVVRYYLQKTTKFKPEQIEKKINQFEQFAELEDEAKSALEELKEIDKQEKAQMAKAAAEYEKNQTKAREEADKLFRKTLKETDEVSGIKINKDKVFSSLYNPVKLEDGTVTTNFNYKLNQVLSDPKKTIFLAHLLENNFELGKIEETKVSTKAAKTLKEKLRQANLSTSSKVKSGDTARPGKVSLSDFS
jgi:chemotaxis protein histidine kinase CheA